MEVLAAQCCMSRNSDFTDQTTQILSEPIGVELTIAVVEANLSKGTSWDWTVQSIIGTVLNPEQGALLVGSRDAVTLLALN